MDRTSVVATVQNYVEHVRRAGIGATRAFVYGSAARGSATPDSDIDLVVIAPDFDNLTSREPLLMLWRLRAVTDSRIEPYPCGVRQWDQDDSSAIIEMARTEGFEVPLR